MKDRWTEIGRFPGLTVSLAPGSVKNTEKVRQGQLMSSSGFGTNIANMWAQIPNKQTHIHTQTEIETERQRYRER